ncbi:MAG: hypothetical protein LBD47_03335 [Treponema sp.]|jgi:hypothetical protein|nr:hypothetical protein [Treponema sp.]
MQQKSVSNKTPIISVVIAAICIVVYVAAMVSAVLRIYINVEQRRTVAEKEFFDIADLASSAGVLGFMDEPFVETITDALTMSATLEAIIITGPNGEYAFEREQGKAVNWVNNSPRFRSRFDFLSQSLYQPLHIAGLRNVNIQAVASAVDYRILTSILKQTLILVLAGLVLAFFTLLMESLLGKSAEKRRYTPSFDAEDRAAEPVSETGTAFSGEPPPVGQAAASQEAAAQAPQEFELPPLPEDEFSEPPADEGEQDEESVAPLKGLYSPRSGVGWDTYMEDRLESELHRCASAEQDLVFIVMEIIDLGFQGDDFYKHFAEDAARFFTPRDLIFERGEQGLAVIYPNIDLETGFAKADEFHNCVMEKYPVYLKAKKDLCMGISSRAGRLVDAGRLMFEAGEALERALSDPVSHIVAFKSNPDKYRAFVASQKTKRS